MGRSEYDPAAEDRRPWKVGRIVGAKRAQKPQQVWVVRFWLDRERRLRDRAMFDLAIDSKLSNCPLIAGKSQAFSQQPGSDEGRARKRSASEAGGVA